MDYDFGHISIDGEICCCVQQQWTHYQHKIFWSMLPVSEIEKIILNGENCWFFIVISSFTLLHFLHGTYNEQLLVPHLRILNYLHI